MQLPTQDTVCYNINDCGQKENFFALKQCGGGVQGGQIGLWLYKENNKLQD
jgi:hypothetical protein